MWVSSTHFKHDKFPFIRFQSEHVPNPNEVPFTLMIALWSFMSTFILCMLGEIVTDEFDAFYETLCNTINWHLLPNELRRMLVIFVGATQKPAHVRGYGSTVFTREAFKRVNGVFVVQFGKR